jgi:predicted KAP-like P-loop ATPase
MEIKIRPIEIPSETPFVNDELDRQAEIKNLTELLVNIETPLVFTIDAKWGSGKTTFIKMWQADLSNQEIFSLYFNAWETDFAEDPLIAFLGELNSSINH